MIPLGSTFHPRVYATDYAPFVCNNFLRNRTPGRCAALKILPHCHSYGFADRHTTVLTTDGLCGSPFLPITCVPSILPHCPTLLLRFVWDLPLTRDTFTFSAHTTYLYYYPLARVRYVPAYRATYRFLHTDAPIVPLISIVRFGTLIRFCRFVVLLRSPFSWGFLQPRSPLCPPTQVRFRLLPTLPAYVL